MKEKRTIYPCKPYPRKILPYGFRYPCKTDVLEEVSEETTEGEVMQEVEDETVEFLIRGNMETNTENVHCTWKEECSFPFSKRCRFRYRTSELILLWRKKFQNAWKKKGEREICSSPPKKDSYEVMTCKPFCETKSEEIVVIREPFTSKHCVFCNGSLYRGGTTYDLFETVPKIIRQSKINNDDVAYRIGIRTRITVHKRCYSEYIKRPILPKEEDHECMPNASPKVQVTTNMSKFKQHGLVADLWPNIRLMQLSGHFLHEYHENNGGMQILMRRLYSSVHLILVLLQFAAITANLVMESDDVNDLAADTITVLFFTHCVTKFCYFALRRKKFYRTLASWNSINSHPLFAESHARHRAQAITRSRRLLMIIVIGTLFTAIGWTGSTFFGDSTKSITNSDDKNETLTIEIPRLMMRSWYPWDAMSGTPYILSFIYQLYWIIFTMFHSNLLDVLFCSWLIYACEQLLHVKEIMKPLMDLSSSLDTFNPSSTELFKAANMMDDNYDSLHERKEEPQVNLRGIYSSMRDFGLNKHTGQTGISTINGIGPNGLSKKHEMLVRSAIKYWVERHKHIVRYVTSIGDAYGVALLLHMLTSTITLTLLAYQATKIETFDLYAVTVIGYLFYTLAQVFTFCVFGNQLIEESSSVMEAAYSCQWYDGSEEAKTFVQIVCQQCQKAMSISGAKFFTVSLDLFASVLGAVVTYFMVLVQLK